MNDSRIDSRRIKIHNRGMVFDYILKNKMVSKQDIVAGLHLSLPTVTQNLNTLTSMGLVDGTHEIKFTGGRNAKGFCIVGSARVAIGVNLTAHHMNAVSVNLLGEVGTILRKRINFDLDSEEYLRELGSMVDTIVQDDRIDPERLLGVGIGVPGTVSEDGSVVTNGGSFGFTGKTRDEICKFIQYPCTLFHDAHAAGYAEMQANKDLGDALYLGLSNALYGSVILHGNIFHGDNHRAGDVGNMIISVKGSNISTVDSLCNAGLLDSLTAGNLNDFFVLLAEKDKKAVKAWDNYLDNLAITIHNLRAAYGIKIVLGGYVGAYTDTYLPDLFERINKLDMTGERAEDYVVQCVSKVESIAVGAARIFVDEFMASIAEMDDSEER